MKINLTEELNKNSLLSHVVLHGITYATKEGLVEEIGQSCQTEKGVVIDVVLTANGTELNLESFVNHWQRQVEKAVNKKAEELIDEKFSDLSDLIYDLQERLKPEIRKRLEDWEKE